MSGPVKKLECSFGDKCYRLNPTHFIHNSHAHLENLMKKVDTNDEDNIIVPENHGLPQPTSTLVKQLKVLLELQRRRDGPPAAVASPHRPQKTLTRSPSPARRAASPKGVVSSAPRAKKLKLQAEAGTSSSGSHSGLDLDSGGKPSRNQKHGDMAFKWACAEPFHFFLSRIEDSPNTHDEGLSVTFADLYDGGLGELEASLQINFMIDVNFLLPQIINMGCYYQPMLILYETSNIAQAKLPDHIKHIEVKAKSAFGHHHTKMSLMYYRDKSVRVVISTANLIPDDWKNYTQGVWISPACPHISEPGVTGESVSGFKASLRAYLGAYQLPQLAEWLERIKHADFSAVKVCLLASVPSSGPESAAKWGLGKIRSLLRQHVPSGVTDPTWPVVAQCSSLGSLGETPSDWFEGQMKAAMLGSSSTAHTKTPFCLVYPCLQDVKNSHDGLAGGGCLPYSRTVHSKQLWLPEFLYRWRSESRHRSKATPHIKTYGRFSPDMKRMAWFLLTSANVSKAAWGRSTQHGHGQNIMSYEAGVLFLPKLLIGKNTFEVSHSGDPGDQKFPVPFDLPLTKYGAHDKLWVSEYLVTES